MTPPREGSPAGRGDAGDGSVSFSMTIENGETVIRMRGDRDTAVVVRSASGERIYLPPEDFDRDADPGDNSPYGSSTDSPYQSSPTDSPYQSPPADSPYDGMRTDSPYQSAGSDSPYRTAESDSPYQGVDGDSPYQGGGGAPAGEGLTSTPDGYRIRHPEPATDVRVLR